MRYLKQSIAATAVIGPALDATDGVTEETGVAASSTLKISKGSAAFTTRSGSASAIAHDANGWYRVPLDTTDTGTLGSLVLIFVDSTTHLPIWHEYTVLAANVYDSLVGGGDTLDVAIPIGAFAASSISAAAFSSNTIVQDIINASAISNAKFAAGAIGTDTLAANSIAIGTFAASALSAAAISNNSITSGILAASAIGGSQLAQNCIGSIQLSAAAISIGKVAASALSAAAFSSNSIVADLIASNAIGIGKIAASAFAASAFSDDTWSSAWARACTEPTSVVSAAPKAIDALSWLLTASRNKLTQTSAAMSIRNDGDSGTVASASVSDDGTTFTRGKFV